MAGCPDIRRVIRVPPHRLRAVAACCGPPDGCPPAGPLPRVPHPQFPARTTRFGSPVTPCGAPSSLAHTHSAVTCEMRPSPLTRRTVSRAPSFVPRPSPQSLLCHDHRVTRSTPQIGEWIRLSTSRRIVAHPEVVSGSTSNGCPRICARRAAAYRLGSSRRYLRQVDKPALQFPKARACLGRSISRPRLPGIRLLRRRSVPVGCPRDLVRLATRPELGCPSPLRASQRIYPSGLPSGERGGGDSISGFPKIFIRLGANQTTSFPVTQFIPASPSPSCPVDESARDETTVWLPNR